MLLLLVGCRFPLLLPFQVLLLRIFWGGAFRDPDRVRIDSFQKGLAFGT